MGRRTAHRRSRWRRSARAGRPGSVPGVRLRSRRRMESLTWRPSDPGHFALHNAIRAAIVVPLVLALGRAIGNDQTALFGVFASFAFLVFVEFGGPTAVRLLAYLALAVVCGGLIVLGTLCSRTPVLAALTMAIL